MEEIKITLETLYDILRNEKQREDLQQLTPTFYHDVVHYLKEKKKLLEFKKDEDDLFAAGEQEKLEYELRSIKRILKEIYEKREKKIIDITMNKSRTGSDIVDTSSLLREEKEFYKLLLGLLDTYRKGILMNLFQGKIPNLGLEDSGDFEKPKEHNQSTELPEEEPLEITKNTSQNMETPINKTNNTTNNTNNTTNKTNNTTNNTNNTETNQKDETTPKMKKIKFIHAVPSFVWTDLKDYGPWEEGEETEIFAEVADLIIEKKRAVEVDTN